MKGDKTMENSVTEALGTVSTALTTQINPATVASVIGLVLGAGIALFLTWFGIRKLISVVKNALRGKLKV